MNELALFAGAGGGILGGKLLGWRTVCAVEWEPYPASVLCARQNDGLLPPFPVWDDVQTFDGEPWRGIVDVVSGGFPCQDISAAGKGTGIDGERSGMWKEMARIIHEVRPRYAFVENSPMLTSRGLGTVLGDLASMGFDARWGVLGAVDVGANHKRDRIWIVAKWRGQLSHAQHNRIGRWEQQQKGVEEASRNMAYTSLSGFQTRNDTALKPQKPPLEKQSWRSSNEFGKTKHWWEVEPNVGRVADGVAARVDRLKAIGNGQVSLCAATAWQILSKDI
jgi:DNA (cytosine-5)-methyltransferase 1